MLLLERLFRGGGRRCNRPLRNVQCCSADSNNDRDICKELALCPLLLFLSPASTSSSGLQCGDSLPHRSCTFAQRVL